MVEASRNGEISRVRELIRKGVNVDAYDNEGKDIDFFHLFIFEKLFEFCLR